MRSLNRTKNTRRNLVWGAVGKLISVLGPFVVRAVLIRRLGAEYLGVSSLFSSVLQVLSLAELGFSSAVVFGMYKPVAEEDIRGVAAYLNFLRGVYRFVGIIILSAGLLAMPFLDRLVHGSPPTGVSLAAAFLIYLLNTALSYLLFGYKQSLLTAYQRRDLVSKTSIIISAIQSVLQVAVLLVWPNYYAYAIVLPLCTVISNYVLARIVDRGLPEFSERSLLDARLSAGAIGNMRKRITGMMVSRVCVVTRNSLDSIIISAFIGLSTVAAYTNYLAVMTGVHGILAIVGSSMVASVGNSIVSEPKEKNYQDLRVFMLLYAVISIIASSCMITCYQPFIALWAGEALVLPPIIPVLIVIYFYVLTAGDMRAVYADATGIWWEQRWRAIAEAVTNVVLNVLLIKFLGLPGVVLATLISLFFINFIYGSHLVFKYYFGMGYARGFYLDQLLYGVIAVVSCAMSWYLGTLIPVSGVVGLLFRMIVATVVSVIVMYAALRKNPLYEKSLAFVRRVARK